MLMLKLQYFGRLMQRANSIEKTLMLGNIESRRRKGNRGWDGWMASLTQWTWVWVNSRSCWWTGRPGMLQFMGSQRLGHNLVTGQQIKGLHIPLGDLVSSPLGSSKSYHEKLQIICHVSQYLFKLTQFREFGVQIGNFSQTLYWFYLGR